MVQSCMDNSEPLSNIFFIEVMIVTFSGNKQKWNSMTIYISWNGIRTIVDPVERLLPTLPTTDLFPSLIIGLNPKDVEYSMYFDRAIMILLLAHVSNRTPLKLVSMT